MRRRIFALLLALCCAALLSSCGKGKVKSGALLLYYAPVMVEGGPSLVGEESDLTVAGATVEEAMAALLSGPDSEHLARIIPAGVELLGADLEDGCATVDLSEGYGALSDVNLTLANYSITLTLCQLEGVERVKVAVDGRDVTGEMYPTDVVQDGAPPTETPED